MKIRLRRTRQDDLDLVLTAEHIPENLRFISGWTRAEHLAALQSEDIGHMIVERTADGARVGYLLLFGLANKNKSIELRRLVITEKHNGFGRETMRLVKAMAFEQLGAHRLWLDVKEHNARARHVYASEGFVVEGMLRECVKADGGYESLVLMSMLEAEYRRATISFNRAPLLDTDE